MGPADLAGAYGGPWQMYGCDLPPPPQLPLLLPPQQLRKKCDDEHL